MPYALSFDKHPFSKSFVSKFRLEVRPAKRIYARCPIEQISPLHLSRRLANGIGDGDLDGCWVWVKERSSNGYGRLTFCRRTVGAHRLAYALAINDVAADAVAMHKCDNPPCINPKHLLVGTASNNNRDKINKHRHLLKITNSEKEQIFYLLSKGHPKKNIAQLFGVNPSTLWRALKKDESAPFCELPT